VSVLVLHLFLPNAAAVLHHDFVKQIYFAACCALQASPLPPAPLLLAWLIVSSLARLLACFLLL
jgi:hypothetical protein